MNHSVSYAKGTLRGMHFQHPPFREIKMVRCIAGAVMDVIVDIRQGSPTFLQWQAVELSAKNNRMIYIPEGFAHGFQTLQDNSALIYHHTEFYTPGAEGGIRYDDPLVDIRWTLPVTVNVLNKARSSRFSTIPMSGRTARFSGRCDRERNRFETSHSLSAIARILPARSFEWARVT